jgi:tRNA threonylcarbamoyladenosine biosynthesis protein TsaE
MVDEVEILFTRDAPLLAWRLFRVRQPPDGYALGSPMIHSPAPPPWQPGLTVARCFEHDHAAPAPGCRCGIYGAVEGTLDSLPGYLRDTAYDEDPWAYAEIACSGRVFLDARGVRCEEASLVQIALVEESFASDDERAAAGNALSELYGVSVGSAASAPAWLTENARPQGPAAVADVRVLPSGSAEDTEAIAARLAGALRAGDLVTVSGELGSGKTTFVRGACRALGVTGAVTSPTFTIGHRYQADPDVSHLDLFRFRGLSPAEWGDLEPYFEDSICFVEWPEAAAGALPPVRVEVRLSHVDPAHRLITLESSEKSLLDRLFGGADSRL